MNGLKRTVIGIFPARLLSLISRNQWRSPLLRRVCAWGAASLKQQDGSILRGVGKGLKFNAGSSHSGFILGNHEAEVQQLLATVLRPGMVYYDAGANVGFFAVIAARLVGPSGQVVCFEPLPANARQIEYNAHLNGFSNIVVRPEALGGNNRLEVFQTSAEPTWGSLATVGKPPDQASGQISVSVRTLDSLKAAEGLRAPDIIKMDIEGAEVEALEGAAETLKSSRPLLVIELHDTNLPVTSFLESLNYDSAVLGSDIAVNDAHWDANIVSVPQERSDLARSAAKFTEGLAAR